MELNENLSKLYIKEADETLIQMLKITGKWKIITAYYACYNSLYAILMKCGIKSEIHDCTIELMSLFDFNENEINFLNNLKTLRVQVQYYLKDKSFKDEIKVKNFILKCKMILTDLNDKEIKKIRSNLI